MALLLGLSTADLNNLTIGMVFDLALFRTNDKEDEKKYEREAKQTDFDCF